MKIEFDPAKRAHNLVKHGLDLADAGTLLEGRCIWLVDDRYDYGEERLVSYGLLRGEVAVCVWVEQADSARIISLRKANKDEEEDWFKAIFG